MTRVAHEYVYIYMSIDSSQPIPACMPVYVRVCMHVCSCIIVYIACNVLDSSSPNSLISISCFLKLSLSRHAAAPS